MTTDETTRIEFAERQGWRNFDLNPHNNYLYGLSPGPMGVRKIGPLPDPTDHNHVHTALMAMSEEEWNKLSVLVCKDVYLTSLPMVRAILTFPLPTLVSCYLEATKGRIKQSPVSSTSAQS